MMTRREALGLAIVAVQAMARRDPEYDWPAAQAELADMLRDERLTLRHGKSLHSGTARRWAAIEAKFDEPIRDVIQGLRDQGNTWRTVAGVLDISQCTLVLWRRKLGLPIDGHVQFDDLSREDMRHNSNGHNTVTAENGD